MGQLVIVVYKPKEGKAGELKKLTLTHVLRLRQEGLVTDREAVIMETTDGSVIEIFEWLSQEAIDQANHNPHVLKMWAEYDEVCEYVPLNTLDEAGAVFAGFKPLN